MVLVIDANVLFSALLNPVTMTTKIITDRKAIVYVPRFCIVELFKYKEKILAYSKMDEETIYLAFHALLKALRFIDDDTIAESHIMKAAQLCDGIDPNDTVYVAAALALDAYLWTGDKKLIKGLREKGFSTVVTTAELESHLPKL